MGTRAPRPAGASTGARGAARPGTGTRFGGPNRGGDRKGGPSRGRDGRTGGRFERPKPEYEQKSIDVRRVTRVTSGGKRFAFSVAMIIGDRKGKVGVGTGKAGDISAAMEKAAKDAKKHMIIVRTTKSRSISHDVKAKSSSAIVELRPAPSRGLVAGSAVRNVLELAGVADVTAKVYTGSKNKLNIARATIKALGSITNRQSKATATAAASTEVTASN